VERVIRLCQIFAFIEVLQSLSNKCVLGCDLLNVCNIEVVDNRSYVPNFQNSSRVVICTLFSNLCVCLNVKSLTLSSCYSFKVPVTYNTRI